MPYFIDPTVQGDDRARLIAAMDLMEPDERENVVLTTDDDRFIANRPSLLSEWAARSQDASGANFDAEGSLVPSPSEPSSPAPGGPTPTNEGPYRRVKSNYGYSAKSAVVFLPFANFLNAYQSQNANGAGLHTIYVYLGEKATVCLWMRASSTVT